MEINFLEALKSSIVLLILLGCSGIAVTFIFERWIYLKRMTVNSEMFFTQIREAVGRGGLEAAISVCAASMSALASVVRAGLEEWHEGARGQNGSAEMMSAVATEERGKLEKNLGILGTLGNIAPLLGLIGTVIGIIRAFQSMAMTGQSGPSVISAGIAEALTTTVAGLLVAIPAVIAYNFYLRRVNTIMAEIDSVSKKVNVMLDGLNGLGHLGDSSPHGR